MYKLEDIVAEINSKNDIYFSCINGAKDYGHLMYYCHITFDEYDNSLNEESLKFNTSRKCWVEVNNEYYENIEEFKDCYKYMKDFELLTQRKYNRKRNEYANEIAFGL